MVLRGASDADIRFLRVLVTLCQAVAPGCVHQRIADRVAFADGTAMLLARRRRCQ
jgi:hypothetical protein